MIKCTCKTKNLAWSEVMEVFPYRYRESMVTDNLKSFIATGDWGGENFILERDSTYEVHLEGKLAGIYIWEREQDNPCIVSNVYLSNHKESLMSIYDDDIEKVKSLGDAYKNHDRYVIEEAKNITNLIPTSMRMRYKYAYLHEYQSNVLWDNVIKIKIV